MNCDIPPSLYDKIPLYGRCLTKGSRQVGHMVQAGIEPRPLACYNAMQPTDKCSWDIRPLDSTTRVVLICYVTLGPFHNNVRKTEKKNVHVCDNCDPSKNNLGTKQNRNS